MAHSYHRPAPEVDGPPHTRCGLGSLCGSTSSRIRHPPSDTGPGEDASERREPLATFIPDKGNGRWAPAGAGAVSCRAAGLGRITPRSGRLGDLDVVRGAIHEPAPLRDRRPRAGRLPAPPPPGSRGTAVRLRAEAPGGIAADDRDDEGAPERPPGPHDQPEQARDDQAGPDDDGVQLVACSHGVLLPLGRGRDAPAVSDEPGTTAYSATSWSFSWRRRGQRGRRSRACLRCRRSAPTSRRMRALASASASCSDSASWIERHDAACAVAGGRPVRGAVGRLGLSLDGSGRGGGFDHDDLLPMVLDRPDERRDRTLRWVVDRPLGRRGAVGVDADRVVRRPDRRLPAPGAARSTPCVRRGTPPGPRARRPAPQ